MGTGSAAWTGLSPVNKVLPISPSTTAIDGLVASNNLPSSNPASTSSMLLNGYVAAVVPAGAVNVSYTLNVAHQETGAANGDVAALTATIGSCVLTVPIHRTTATTPPVTDALTNTAFPCLAAAVASNFSVTFVTTAKKSKAITENLDGINLVVTYTAPAVRAESGCLLTDIVNCNLLKVGGANTSKVYVWGTVYAPLGSVLTDSSSTSVCEFRRGVVARSVKSTGTEPAAATTYSLGAGSPAVGPTRVLLLTASVGGTPRVRALLSYVDGPSLGISLQIVSWNVLR